MNYKTSEQVKSGSLAGQRILVVDDAEDDRMLLSNFLLCQGARLYISKDGQDAYRKAQSVRPDLILMDVRMPGYDGVTSCRLLQANPCTRTIPLIFLSAAVSTEEKIKGLKAGAVDYVTKPFDFDEMRLRLCVHLRTTVSEAVSPAPGTPAPETATSGTNSVESVLFTAARRLMLEKLDQPLGLNELAAAVGTNARRLSSAFRRCSGVTVFDFLREERMKEARRMLSETTLDIGSIAQALGYSNTANFSTAFRERFGMPPSQFRR